MGNLIIFCSTLAVIGSTFVFIKTFYTLDSLCQRTESAWAQLTSSLADRHLVISHLVDAISPSLDARGEISELSSACDQAQSCLGAIQSESLSPANVDSVADSQLRLCEALETVLAMIERNEKVKALETVQGCLRGIETADEKTGYARVAYNDAAITHRTFVSTKLPSLIAQRTRGQREYWLIDWSPQASSINQPSPPPT